MNIVSKLTSYEADWFDVALTKIAVFWATLLLAKFWAPVLSLEWYWYVLFWALAAIKPTLTAFTWFKASIRL